MQGILTANEYRMEKRTTLKGYRMPTEDGYLDIELEVGKWYISDEFQGAKEQLSEAEELALASSMIVAGPFDSQQAADDELAWFAERADPFSWRFGKVSWSNASQGDFHSRQPSASE